MQRRTFLQTLSAAAAVTALPAAVVAQTAGLNIKITDIKLRKIRLVRELGPTPQRNPMPPFMSRVGGETIIEIHTNQGLTGISSGVSPAAVERAKRILVGKDPMLIDQHAYDLFAPEGGGANVEIALWDLIGKIVNQPLWKLWGGTTNKLMPYASQHYEATPEEGAAMAQRVLADGWRAIKYHMHFETMKEDVAFVQKVRQVMGPDFHFMCDVNQAGSYPDGWGGGWCRWDMKRAMDSAKEFHDANMFWLEEPLPRWAFDDLADLCASTPLQIAGGEGSRGLHEWAWMMDKKAMDIQQFEVSLIGPTISRQISALALSHNKTCVPHGGGGELVKICAGHLSASFPNAVRIGKDYPSGPTWELFYQPPNADILQMWEVFEKPLTMDKATGIIALSDAPGLGMTYKADLIQDI